MKARLPKEYQSSGGTDMNSMIKQAQKMQENMQTLQAELDVREYTATSGGGMVECTVTGTHELKNLKINPDVVDPDDVDMLSDLVIAAVNEAIREAISTSEAEMEKISGGLNIPGVF